MTGKHNELDTARVFLAILILWTSSSPVVSAQSKTSRASITIDATHSTGNISPLLYGQFIEHMFEGVKFGLDSELLRDRSFEDPPNVIGLPRYWERYPDDRNDDYAINFTWDDTVSYPEQKQSENRNAEHSLRVDAGDGVIRRHGVFQSRLPVRAGDEYAGYLWLKTTNYDGRVIVALEADTSTSEVYAESSFSPASGNWRKYEFRLRPTATDPLARFAIIFTGRGRLWVDHGSLQPANSIGGVRRDVFTKIKQLHPAFIRWPGGNVAQDYHWQLAVGPRDQRTAWTNLSWKNEVEPADFGTIEFIELSQDVGAEPSITVNVEGLGATAEEAAAWVEYCNGPESSKYGALRAVHGHPRPYGVKLWEVGNEIWGSWVRGHSDAETYARNFLHYAAAMRKVDPNIKLIAVGDNDMNWNRTVLTLAGSEIDYLAIHHYYGRREMAGDARNLMARPLYYEDFYRQMAELLKQLSPRHEIKLAINEWGLDLTLQEQYSMRSALYGARLMNVFERTDGLVAMSAVSDLVNGWPGGIIQAGRQGLFVSPIYLVNQIYAENLGGERLSTTVNSPTFDSRERKAVPYLDVVASRSSNHKQVFVKIANTDLTRAFSTTVSLKGVRIRPRVEVATVNGQHLDSFNSFATPNAIRLQRSTVVGGSTFSVSLPAHSVSVLQLDVQP